jgi:SAM-dependent methyltransferase
MPSDEHVQASITAFWSKIAQGYEAHPGNVPAPDSAEYAAWVDAVRYLLPPAPANVLDVATGTGFLSIIASKLGHRVTAIDASSEMLNQARANAAAARAKIEFERADAVDSEFPAASFDAITSRHFIWTLREPERAFRNWYRLLRPSGRVIAIDGFWFSAPQEATADSDEAPGLFEEHYTRDTRAALPTMRLSSPEPIAEMFRAAGFPDVCIGDLAHVHALAKDPPGEKPWYVIIATRSASS